MARRRSPLARTIDYFVEQGYAVDVVERRVGPVTKDLFGFIDALAIRRDETVALQVTSCSNMSARVKKIVDSDLVGRVREAGWRILVVGWDHRDQPRIVDVS